MAEENSPARSLPEKLYYRVKEVSSLAGVPPYVLRFWETEFPRIRPKRSPSGQRLYRRQDVELILRIRHLLYDRKFTIEGARQHLAAAPSGASLRVKRKALAEIEAELRDLLRQLKVPPTPPTGKADPGSG